MTDEQPLTLSEPRARWQHCWSHFQRGRGSLLGPHRARGQTPIQHFSVHSPGEPQLLFYYSFYPNCPPYRFGRNRGFSLVASMPSVSPSPGQVVSLEMSNAHHRSHPRVPRTRHCLCSKTGPALLR